MVLGSDPALSAFAGLAEAFCARLEDAASRPEELLDAVHRLLPRLYAGALQLPPTSTLDEDAGSSGSGSFGSPAGLAGLRAFLGDRIFYREIFNPYSNADDEEEVTGDLIDDLGDIHRDLMSGLLHWRAGRAGHALWQWRFNFEIHWGEHATSALRALYGLSHWRGIPWPEGSGGQVP